MPATQTRVATDAIVPVEDWISEHYFTTDARRESFLARVLERRKAWDDEKDHGTVRTRWTGARGGLLSRAANLTVDSDDAEVRAFHAELATVLGFLGEGGYVRDRQGPVTFLHSAGLPEPLVALVDAKPVGAPEELVAKDADTLLESFAVDETTELESVARLLSALFVRDHARPAFVLVFAGSRLLLAERERWPEGRYLTVDLQLVLERADNRKGGEVDRALTCVSAESVAPDAEGTVWWHGVLEESVKHTVGVSQDLRDGVRFSIEIIGNEVVRRREEQGLSPLPADQAQPLAKQALRFLYRILFLLYAEASPELGVLPAGTPEYERGYSLDRLRDLTLVELSTPQARNGTHLYESLGVLFRMVDKGHVAAPASEGEHGHHDGLTFRPLRADLFRAEATAHIDAVGLGNRELQRVLEQLLLSKASGKRDRGFISYAELGINQLGAVYEGLMSYTGTFAEDDLYEVAKNGNPEKGSWVVPTDRAEDLSPQDFVCDVDPVTGEERPIVHQRGSFVFRLAGRERQQSASYYTPEVLTRFVVSQALEELLDQDGHTTTAEEILELTICEPALGSGAFAIEAVRQLAEQYLRRRQEETGKSIEPDEYPRELQRVKAYLALHQTYGVDLNATAVELAEISLWLDTMVAGLEAPWFGLRLRRGNSLIGARKAVYSRGDVTSGDWLTTPATPVGAGEDPFPEIGGQIPHFLLPAQGWGAAAGVGKDGKELVPDAVPPLRDWRREVRKKPAKKQVDRLVALGHRVERLWDFATRRLEIAALQTRRDIDIWGLNEGSEEPAGRDRPVKREEIEETLAHPDGAYQRLRLVMDAWCALWFWPLDEERVRPPSFDAWIAALEGVLGVHDPKPARTGQVAMADAATWDELADAEALDLQVAGATAVSSALAGNDWLTRCQELASQLGFFHWELDYAPVFAQRKGFDLQVGNPPWVRPETKLDALQAEWDPWWALVASPTRAQTEAKRAATLSIPEVRKMVVAEFAQTAAMGEFVGASANYPALKGMTANLYRCFMESAWAKQRVRGVVALIHPEGHFTDDAASMLRRQVYARLRRHWHFVNELKLFEIQNQKWYGVHIYGAPRTEPAFAHAAYLFHPVTVERSLRHDGSGEEPGIRDAEGNWNVAPHRNRVIQVGRRELEDWNALAGGAATEVRSARMAYAVGRAGSAALGRVAKLPRVVDLGLQADGGLLEKPSIRDGLIDVSWGGPGSWAAAVLQGSHIFTNRPVYKIPNRTMRSQRDWSLESLEAMTPDYVPITSYEIRADDREFDARSKLWNDGSRARHHYRVAWRKMAANTGERTLASAIIPPGATHSNGINSAGSPGLNARGLATLQGVASSLVADFVVRAVAKDNIYLSSVERLPMPSADGEHPVVSLIALRVLRLNALTAAYADLWGAAYGPDWLTDSWAGGLSYEGRPALSGVSSSWHPQIPLRRDADRRQAALEIDSLVALWCGMPVDELCLVYRAHFPVLAKYDDERYVFDKWGRVVPIAVLQEWRKRGAATDRVARTAVDPHGRETVYELPFLARDREGEMRQAYAHFERVLQEGTDG